MLYFVGGNPQSERFAPAFAHIVETRKGVERKRIPVEVIFQVENAGKPCAGKLRLIPGAVLALVLGKPLRGTFARGIVRAHGCKQANQRPRGLRSGALPLSF